MDKLSGLLAFVKTAELGSFVAAGRVLEMSASAVGKAVARLEDEVGVRLLQRSTRRMQLTAEGQIFAERCRRILEEIDDAKAMLTHAAETPRGRLRVSAPIVAHHFLLPVVAGFIERYPEVEPDIHFTDRTVDLIDDGIDVVIRSGDLPDSRLVSRPLQRFRLLLCASPEYLARRGTPATLADLAGHVAIRFRHPNSGKLLDWPLKPGDDGTDAALPRTVLSCNNIEAVLAGCLRGLGIACLPDFLVGPLLAQGRLRSVLDEHLGPGGQFKAIWASSRQVPPKVRLFVDHLRDCLPDADGARTGSVVCGGFTAPSPG